MVIYGLYGMTHGWGRVLTVMCAEGVAAADNIIVPGEGIEVSRGAGRLTQYFEKREGALARLVEAHGIVVLSREEWATKKQELGAQFS